MNRLDLHGVRHGDVDRLVENFILLNQTEVPLTIICGNSDRMIKLVKRVVDRLGVDAIMQGYSVVRINRI
jgi:hypothetical protein